MYRISLQYILQEKSVRLHFSKGKVCPERGKTNKVIHCIPSLWYSSAHTIMQQKWMLQQKNLTEETFSSFPTYANTLR